MQSSVDTTRTAKGISTNKMEIILVENSDTLEEIKIIEKDKDGSKYKRLFSLNQKIQEIPNYSLNM